MRALSACTGSETTTIREAFSTRGMIAPMFSQVERLETSSTSGPL